jgi:hypothetical protein
VRFWRGVDPTLPPPTLFEVAVIVLYKHCSITANQIFKKHDPKTKHPTPLKILKNSQGSMSNVGHYNIKKAPPASTSGAKMATETIKEKQ